MKSNIILRRLPWATAAWICAFRKLVVSCWNCTGTGMNKYPKYTGYWFIFILKSMSLYASTWRLDQCFSTFARPRPDKIFFHKTRARSQQIYSSVPFQYFLSSYIKLKQVLIINYGIIINSISTLMRTVWHVEKYKITFKLVINSRRISRGPV
jgi:hypothetical protein